MRIVIAGDSTAKDYNAQQYPLSGWGSMLRCAVGPEVTIDDRAQAGRSTKSFMAEGRLDAIARTLKPGDTLLIQFGHNDANQAKPERYTPIPDYEANLKHFIAVARMAHAQPVLITPVTRRAFKDGHVVPSFPTYSAAAKRVAEETKVPLIDLAALSERWIDALGPDGSKRYYLHYAKGEGCPAIRTRSTTTRTSANWARAHRRSGRGRSRGHRPADCGPHPEGSPALRRDTPAGGPSCTL